jgi:hypothetical protein
VRQQSADFAATRFARYDPLYCGTPGGGDPPCARCARLSVVFEEANSSTYSIAKSDIDFVGSTPMTDAEWLACCVPDEMVKSVAEGASQRKLRLFACACCRRAWGLLAEERSRAAVEGAERYADGVIEMEEIRRARLDAYQAYRVFEVDGVVTPLLSAAQGAWYCLTRFSSPEESRIETPVRCIESLVEAAIYRAVVDFDSNAPDWDGPEGLVRTAEWAAQADLLRDVFGNPFRPVTLATGHRTPVVVSLAGAAYEERQLPSGELDSHRLAVLADALEEAGAPDALVAHLRRPGPHVRGCFAVDACLGLS